MGRVRLTSVVGPKSLIIPLLPVIQNGRYVDILLVNPETVQTAAFSTEQKGGDAPTYGIPINGSVYNLSSTYLHKGIEHALFNVSLKTITMRVITMTFVPL